MFRIASRLALVALPFGLAGCFVATPYDDEPHYAGYASPPAVVVERPEYRWATPHYRVEEHVYAPRRRVYYGDDRHERHESRERHDDHGHGRGHDRDHDHDHDRD